jgi:hypothetical protein
MINAAKVLKLRYPKATFRFYLGGQRIAARYAEIVLADGECQLDHFGPVRSGPDAMNVILDIDLEISLRSPRTAPAPLSTPKSFPSGTPTNFGWSDLVVDAGKWKIDPTFTSPFTIPSVLKPVSDHIVRVMLDGDIIEGREAEFLDIVKRFDGNIEIVLLPKVVMEKKAGSSKKEAEARKKYVKKLLDLKKTTKFPKGALLARARPTLYRNNKTPLPNSNHFEGDLAIRVQLGRAIESLENTWSGQRLTVLWATQDYGNGELMRSVESGDTTTFHVLRVDAGEKGQVLKNLIFGGIQHAFRGK